jgi:hypothetical protein
MSVSIANVANVLENEPYILKQKSKIANILEIPPAESQQIFQHYNTGVFTAYDVFRDFLIIWVGRQDLSRATIGSLAILLEQNGFRAAAGNVNYQMLSILFS